MSLSHQPNRVGMDGIGVGVIFLEANTAQA
jgi:hypothetical protein